MPNSKVLQEIIQAGCVLVLCFIQDAVKSMGNNRDDAIVGILHEGRMHSPSTSVSDAV